MNPNKQTGSGIMSVDISRFIGNALREKTTIYSPVIEAIVNSIEAIRETKRTDGKIIIKPIRSVQMTMDTEALPDVTGFIVEDNGIGFNIENRNAFDTLFTDYKVETGGMGVGRFIFLKYFKKASFSSIYKDNGKYRKREFTLGSKTEIIEYENLNEVTKGTKPQNSEAI